MKTIKLQMTLSLWKKLIKELNKRGEGKRETGAFLLGPKSGKLITEFICYNDLDPHAFNSGIIIFNGDGYIPLWKKCSEANLKVLADVHTHPGDWTDQSGSDMKYPMVAQAGHIALIIPFFAVKRNQLLNGVGIHEFLGNKKWRTFETNSEVFELLR
jgi:proteasome lid subunit RPN8/RPN11